jgi:hypothetical protein
MAVVLILLVVLSLCAGSHCCYLWQLIPVHTVIHSTVISSIDTATVAATLLVDGCLLLLSAIYTVFGSTVISSIDTATVTAILTSRDCFHLLLLIQYGHCYCYCRCQSDW